MDLGKKNVFRPYDIALTWATGGRGTTQGHLAKVSLGFSMFTDVILIVILMLYYKAAQFHLCLLVYKLRSPHIIINNNNNK